MCSKKIAIVILLLGCSGCCKTESQNCVYEPCSRAWVDAIANFPVGNWVIDKDSLEFLRTEFKWTTLLNQRDHWLAIHNDGTALVRSCLSAYGESEDVDYKRQLNVAGLCIDAMFDELIDADRMSSNNYVIGRSNVQTNAYKMHWRVVGREEWLCLHKDRYEDYFDRYYFNVDYQNQFEVCVVFYEKHGGELFFAVGKDNKGIYLTPRVYRSRFKNDLMELAVKFRRRAERLGSL